MTAGPVRADATVSRPGSPVTAQPTAAAEPAPGAAVAAEGIRLELGGRPVLDDVTLLAPAGRMTGLLGPNGSGKSTLLRTLWHQLNPSIGAVLIGGLDVAGLSVREIARLVAVLGQDDGTDPGLTVRETVGTGRLPHRTLWGGDPAADTSVDRALSAAAVVDLADRRLDTLSGGQRQRVRAARTLAQDTPVILLDEPTNHLDLAAQHDLLHLFRGRCRGDGDTVVVALHDLALAATYCDRLVVLAAGRVVASGPPDDVLTADLVEQVFGVAAAITTNPLTGTRAVHTGRRLTSEDTP